MVSYGRQVPCNRRVRRWQLRVDGCGRLGSASMKAGQKRECRSCCEGDPPSGAWNVSDTKSSYTYPYPYRLPWRKLYAKAGCWVGRGWAACLGAGRWALGAGADACSGAHRHLVLVSYRQMHRPMHPTYVHFVDARFTQGCLWIWGHLGGYWGRD